MMEEMILEAGKNRLYKLLVAAKDMSLDQLERSVGEAFRDIAAMALNEKNLLDETGVSQLYPFTIGFLRKRRARGDGPVYHKFGGVRNGLVFYKVEDLESWIRDHRQDDPIKTRLLARG